MGAFGKITGHEILNKALAECANDPDIVYRRQPMVSFIIWYYSLGDQDCWIESRACFIDW